MGNINNIWYLKGEGGSWAENKCQIDKCYSIPFDASQDNLFLQVDIPQGFWVNSIWLCDMQGNRVQDIMPLTDWKVIDGDDLHRLFFRMPNDSYACNGMPADGCFVDILNDNIIAVIADNIDRWYNGEVGSTLAINYGGTVYDLGNVGDMPALPPDWSWIDDHTIAVPCGVLWPGFVQYQTYTTTNGGFFGTFGNNVQTGSVGTTPLSCFYIEVPLLGGASGIEQATLASEPFECPACVPTVKISGDYCLDNTDIDGDFYFNLEGLAGEHYGGLNELVNDFRIQAVLKQLPSSLTANRNIRCNNFKSKKTKRFKLQGAVDFPDYMVNVIESIFSAKKLYIDGVEYILNSEQLFTERGVQGYSMKRLDVELTQCEQSKVFDCSCVVPPVSCEDNPITYDSIVAINEAPSTDEGHVYTQDDTYWLAKINFGSISGGTTPYSIVNWYAGGGKLIPNSDFEPFNVNSTDTNFFRRNPAYMEETTESILVEIVDANGCTLTIGNTVVMKDQSCVGFGASITLANLTNNSVEITAISVPFDCFDVTIDDAASGYQVTNINSLPYVVAGLTPNTDYKIAVRVWCTCPVDPDNPMGESSGKIGPIWITTLP